MHSRIMILLCLLVPIAIGTGCGKDKKNPIGFSIEAYMPHTNAPVSGIKWKVVERKYKGFGVGHVATGWTLEGETDANGMASGEFPPKKDLDFSYIIEFDYSEMDLPVGEYSITKGPTAYALLDNASATVNSYEIRILPKMDVQINYLNTACFDATDIFRYKVANIDEYPNHNFSIETWLEPMVLSGCTTYSFSSNRLAGHYVYQWEAVRNGILETGVDTFYVEPGVNAVINMHW